MRWVGGEAAKGISSLRGPAGEDVIESVIHKAVLIWSDTGISGGGWKQGRVIHRASGRHLFSPVQFRV